MASDMNPATQQAFNQGNLRANAAYQAARRRFTIDPITRLEGHGKIDIFLDDKGDVERAYLQVPELRGFEVFSIGRPAEDMPQITSRICGVCPTAHHMASTKALDDLYKVEPTPAGRKIRELVYNTFMLEDHALHVFVLGGPDFIVGPEAPPEQRNIVGVIGKVGIEAGKKVISSRKRLRELIAYFGGKVVHPVLGLPGGVSKALKAEDLPRFKQLAQDGLEFALWTLDVFKQIVLANPDYVKMITSDAFTHKTCYMGMVDDQNKVNFYDGKLRVVDCDGKEVCKFSRAAVSRLRCRAHRAVELHEVHLPQAARLEGLCRRPGHQHLLRRSAGAPERRRRHGHAQGPGRLRGILQDPGRQARAPHAGQPLGARDRDDLCRRAHRAARQRPRDHQPRSAAGPDQRAQGRHWRRGSPARHALPPLRNRRDAA